MSLSFAHYYKVNFYFTKDAVSMNNFRNFRNKLIFLRNTFVAYQKNYMGQALLLYLKLMPLIATFRSLVLRIKQYKILTFKNQNVKKGNLTQEAH